MEKTHEPTIGFTVWPVLLMLEGPSAMIGIALATIYNDHRIARSEWSCEHPFKSRAEFAAHLRTEGKEPRRLGVGVKSSELATQIEAKAVACGIKCVIFRGMTTPTKPNP